MPADIPKKMIPAMILEILRENTDEKHTLDQKEILVLKRMKKKKEPKEIDIKSKIREIEWAAQDNIIIMSTKLDAGSDSNLSPDLLIQAIGRYTGAVIPPENVEISRVDMELDGLNQ